MMMAPPPPPPIVNKRTPVALLTGMVGLLLYVCTLVTSESPTDTFAHLYTVYTAALLLLAACSLI